MSFLKSAIQQTLNIGSAASAVNGEMNNVKVNSGEGNDVVLANGDYNQIVNESGDDNIVLTGDFNDVLSMEGDSTIVAKGNNNAIVTLNGDNEVYSIGNENEIAAMNGNNKITSIGDYNSIVTAYGNNDIYSEGDMNLIQSELGNQVIESHGDGNLINAGNGDHDIFSTGDYNDIVFGNGNSDVIFWGTENRIKGGNGDHSVKTLDWVVTEAPDSYYAKYASLIDDYAVVTVESQEAVVTDVHHETQWVQVNGSVGTGTQGYKDLSGTTTTKTAPSTDELMGMLSDSERAVVEKLDLTETYNGSPRYVFAFGSGDKKVHVYDTKVNKSVVKLPNGNNILYSRNVKPEMNEDGIASYVTYNKTVESDVQTSGKYEDLAGKGEDVYSQTITTGKITTNYITTTYDFAHMSNEISVGDGNHEIYITGSAPVLNYGKMNDCGCCKDETNSKIVQRDAIEVNSFETIEDLKTDILYSIGGEIEKSYTIGSSSSNVNTGSPLIVDFNKDGKVSAEAGLGVDVDNNGTADGAAVGGDKMLAMSDMNGNSKIDGTEVFGDQTVDPFTGKKINAKNGFEALKVVALSAYKSTGIKCLKNGEVDLQALKSALALVGINLGFISDNNTSSLSGLAHVAKINVANYTEQQQSGDVQHNQLGSYTSTDGKTYKTDDVWFKLS